MKRRKLATTFLCVFIVTTLASCGDDPWTADYSSYIEVGKYKGLEAAATEVSVSETELTKEIYSRLEAAKTVEKVKSGTVSDGDIVNIDYVGTLDGKKFDGGSAEGKDLTIGSGEFIDGFEEGLIGEDVGATTVLHLTFPKDYSQSDLAGQDVEFEVTINYKEIDVMPKLDKEFAKKNGADSVEDYRDQVREDLYEAEKADAEDEIRTELWTQVMDDSSVKKDKDGKEKYPQEEVERYEEEITALYEKYSEEYGLELDDFIEQQMNMDRETFEEQLTNYSKDKVKEEMVVYTIAKKEGIELSESDVDEYIDRTLDLIGYDQKSFKESEGESYIDFYGKNNVYLEAYKDKVLDLIHKEAKIK